MVNELKKAIKEALGELGIKAEDILLEHPAELSHGDYSTNVALMYAKEAKMKPKELAEKLIQDSRFMIQGVERVEVAGAGFINFFLKKEFFAEKILEINKKKENYGRGDVFSGKKVIVEFSSPNIAKPFTVGHLRSTIIGDSLAKILSFCGAGVIKDSHLGDWGTQFGKLIVAIKKWGDMNEIMKSEAPVKKLVELYIRFHEEAEKDASLEDEGRAWFLKLEQGNLEARDLWQKSIDVSMKEFSDLYEQLDVKFDTMLGESFFEDKMPSVLKELADKKLAKESEGALVVFFEDEKYPPFIVRKSDGSTIYATRDLATDRYRFDTYGEDVTVINEVGMEQSLYFKQLFETEKMLGWTKEGQRVHIGHGHYRFKDGKMSTRKGNVIWLKDIIDEAIKRATEINKDTAKDVAIGALKFNDLKREAKNDIVFDWEDVLNIKGDSGPYIQYSCVRAKSIMEKAKEENINMEVQPPNGWETIDLEKMMYRFPEIVERAGEEYSPNLIATYLIQLSSEFNKWYAQEKIIDSDNEKSSYKLAITEAFSHVVKNGLNLLGIKVPERM